MEVSWDLRDRNRRRELILGRIWAPFWGPKIAKVGLFSGSFYGPFFGHFWNSLGDSTLPGMGN